MKRFFLSLIIFILSCSAVRRLPLICDAGGHKLGSEKSQAIFQKIDSVLTSYQLKSEKVKGYITCSYEDSILSIEVRTKNKRHQIIQFDKNMNVTNVITVMD